MNARNMVSGASSFRDERQDVERGQQKNVNRAGNGSGDESSDSSSSVNNKDRGRKKQKNNGENRKEPIQGNSSFVLLCIVLSITTTIFLNSLGTSPCFSSSCNEGIIYFSKILNYSVMAIQPLFSIIINPYL